MSVPIFVPCIVLCVLMTIITTVASKVSPLSGLDNMPPAIQERVRSLPEYRYQVGPVRTTAQRIRKKLPLFIVIIVLFTIITHKLGARDFVTAFVDVLILWVVVKLWVSLVLDCAWLAHDRRRWIPGTEDLVSAYQDYKFWLSSIPRSILAGAIVGVIVGAIAQVLSMIL